MKEKLVRDRIPQVIEESGKKPVTRTASREEFNTLLVKKLKEEVKEFKSSGEVEELADILEVVETIGIAKGLSMRQLNRIKMDKYKKRGSFSKRTVLIRID
jgi:predicted house-cleaning noncanonical NTP pyrophosphatase (MazG superfamily)